MKKFTVSALILIGLIVVADILIGIVGDKAIVSIPDFGGDVNKTNYILNKMTPDAVIFGSSRASHHYIISTLKDSLSANLFDYSTIYNAGIDGVFTNCNCCAIESMLNRHIPKVIIFDVNPFSFCEENEVKMNRLSVYYKMNDSVRDYINRQGLKNKVLMQSSLYRLNSYPIRILYRYFSKVAPNDGYEPLYNVMSEEIANKSKNDNDNKTPKINSFTRESFERVIKLAKEKEVLLIVAVSPLYGKVEKGIEFVSDICAQNQIPFINMSSENYFNCHPELFQDPTHLNDAGAEIYTSMFFQRIHQFLPQPII